MDKIKAWLEKQDWLIVVEEVADKGQKEERVVLLRAVSPSGSQVTFKENPKGGVIVG